MSMRLTQCFKTVFDSLQLNQDSQILYLCLPKYIFIVI
jgi:hypothetical protein